MWSRGSGAQTPDRITQAVDSTQMKALPNHHPLWAIPDNSVGAAPADLNLNQLTLVLARSPAQEQALEQLLAEQQDPASIEYHRWLTPAELGERFGPTQHDIDAVTAWLQAQGLRVNWVAPSGLFIGFGGTAGAVGQAFNAPLRYYKVDGAERLSVSSDPMVPRALAPAITAIRGLYTVEDRPAHRALVQEAAGPQATDAGGDHFIAPMDFQIVYDASTGYTGSGETIGIVGWARANNADFDNFRALTGASFPDPTEVVPTAYGGVDPGSAYTSPPTGNVSLAGQEEATLDVLRAGSVAPGARLLLVVSSPTDGNGDGIGADAQYLVETTPVPVQVMNISFGDCESDAGPSGVAYWNSLFEQAAAEGISVMVASGDSGASGCDLSFAAPPSSPLPNSPNYICSSSYATCVGGTEFNDSIDPSAYWSAASGPELDSALGYIPEGGWNEPVFSNLTQVAASEGGVSRYVATPVWQSETAGIPVANTGRYTPDISFSASCHDGYFGCMAADGGSCVAGSGGTYSFVTLCGTSAAAPGMAGVAAMLDQKLGGPLGSLNAGIYRTAASVPAAIHDVTITTSGVASCSAKMPSLCNNSIASRASLSGGQPGYVVGNGYDEVTGLGSLDVAAFVQNYSTKSAPSMTVTPSVSPITILEALTVTVALRSATGNLVPAGTVILNSGSFTSAPVTLLNGGASIDIPAGTLAVGSDVLNATYMPDAASAPFFDSASGSASVTVTASPTPTFTMSGTAMTISPGATAGNVTTITITPEEGFTGSVTLTAQVFGPAGAQAQPTVAIGSPNPLMIAGASAVTATLTIATTPGSIGFVRAPARIGSRWYAGGAALACILLFWVPLPRRRWCSMLGVFALLIVLGSGATGCGGALIGTGQARTFGTTAGNYTITITGTSGSAAASTTIPLTVK